MVFIFVSKFSSFLLAEPKNVWFENSLKSVLRFGYPYSLDDIILSIVVFSIDDDIAISS